jgi:hypothetical protein
MATSWQALTQSPAAPALSRASIVARPVQKQLQLAHEPGPRVKGLTALDSLKVLVHDFASLFGVDYHVLHTYEGHVMAAAAGLHLALRWDVDHGVQAGGATENTTK